MQITDDTTTSAEETTTAVRAIDVSHPGPLDTVRAAAHELEALGVGAMWTSEAGHDAFVQSTLALADTARLHVATGIVIALARSPMTIAQTALDLQDLSSGRFVLGLGSQVRAHITKRFSMPWTKPVSQMRELLAAIDAIWDHWYDGAVLDFRGDHYEFTFNSTAFRKVPTHPTRPRVLLAAVGPRMLELAADSTDGFIGHPFVTERYLRERLAPVLARGRRSARPDFERVVSAFVVVDDGSEEAARSLRATRERVALYGSTPAYRGVLDLHGLGGLHEELHRLSRVDEWTRMGDLVDDDVLELFVVRGDEARVVDELAARFGDQATRLRLPWEARRIVPALTERLIPPGSRPDERTVEPCPR